MSEKIELLDLSKEELAAEVAKLGEKPFRAKQLWQWIYNRGVGNFEEMSNLSKDFRAKLAAGYTITRPKIVTEQISKDKTHKWLLEFADGQRVEMVYIPETDRGAVCISTPVFSIGAGLVLIVPSVLINNTKGWFLYPMGYPFYLIMSEYGEVAENIGKNTVDLIPWIPVAVCISLFCLLISCLCFGRNERR